MSKKIIVYPITGNPPTWGHADIMFRAAESFDEVHWVAAINPNKKHSIFTDLEKVEMMEKYVKYYKLGNVTVNAHSGTIIRYAQKVGARFLLEACTTDFQLELELIAG